MCAYVAVSLLTGVRTEEARALRWSHVVALSHRLHPYEVVATVLWNWVQAAPPIRRLCDLAPAR